MKKLFLVLTVAWISFSAQAAIKYLPGQFQGFEFMTESYELRLKNAISKAFHQKGINPQAEYLEEVQRFLKTGREDQFRYLQVFSTFRLDLNDRYAYYSVVSRIEFTGNSMNDQDIVVEIFNP